MLSSKKLTKDGIAGTNNGRLFFAHKLFEFSRDYRGWIL
jgi:hypothetical protein